MACVKHAQFVKITAYTLCYTKSIPREDIGKQTNDAWFLKDRGLVDGDESGGVTCCCYLQRKNIYSPVGRATWRRIPHSFCQPTGCDIDP